MLARWPLHERLTAIPGLMLSKTFWQPCIIIAPDVRVWIAPQQRSKMSRERPALSTHRTLISSLDDSAPVSWRIGERVHEATHGVGHKTDHNIVIGNSMGGLARQPPAHAGYQPERQILSSAPPYTQGQPTTDTVTGVTMPRLRGPEQSPIPHAATLPLPGPRNSACSNLVVGRGYKYP